MSGGAVVIGASGGIGGALEAALIDEAAFDIVHGFARSRSGAQHLDVGCGLCPAGCRRQDARRPQDEPSRGDPVVGSGEPEQDLGI